MARASFCSQFRTYSAIALLETVAMKTFRCKACQRIQPANPRNPDQTHCSRADCQRARKRAWQRKKRATDPDYRQNQIDAHHRWRELHPEYWREYRKRREKGSPPPPDPPAVKMDGLPANFSILPGKYILIPVDGQNINMDAIQVILLPISAGYDQAKDDIIGKIATVAYDCLKNKGPARTPHCGSP